MCDRKAFEDWFAESLIETTSATAKQSARIAYSYQQAKIDALQAQLDHALSNKALAGRWELADKTVNDDGSVTIGGSDVK